MKRALGLAVAATLTLCFAAALLLIGVTGLSSANASLRPGAAIPAEVVPLIESASRTCPDITAPLLAAQLQQESGFRANALSPAGAMGIAQFMPGTWPTWGRDENADGSADPYDPADAIAAQARYMCALVAEVRRSGLTGSPVELALAAYNAGFDAVYRYRGVPPFPETQAYVRNILAAAAASFAAPPAGTGAAAAVTFAYAQLGTPYVWGGETSLGYDCSGLTLKAWAAAGVTLPRTSREQWFAGPHIAVADLQPGDLVFFAYDIQNPATIHHVALYVGNGLIIQAPHTGAVVQVARLAEQPGYIGAARPG